MTSPRQGGPEEGTPEYDWLYGTSTASSSGSADDATRMVPRTPSSPDATRAMPRPEGTPTGDAPSRARSSRYVEQPSTPRRSTPPAGNGPAGGPPTGGPPQGPGRPAGPPPAPRAKRRRPVRTVVLGVVTLLVLMLVYLVAVPFIAWNKVGTIDAMPADKGRPSEQGGTTWLVVGSDSRDNLSKAERKRLGTGGAVGQRTDTIMLLHKGNGPTTLTSLPRDSRVEIPGRGTSKINAAYAWGGPKLLIKTVEQNTGIRIDHYVEIGMGGVVEAVDAVGGIEICPTKNMKDPLANLDIKKGCQQVDGATALAYSRSRHTHANGDIGRAEAQREVVGKVAHKAASPMSVINPVRYWNLWATASKILRVDQDTGVTTAGRFALAMTGAEQTCMVPIKDLAVTWDPERSKKYFGYLINDNLDDMPKGLCTATGMPT